MILVRESEIGSPGYARAVREGSLMPLTATSGAPVDIPASPTLRGLALSVDIPRGAVVSGLAGIWVLRGGLLPSTVDVVRRSGSHRARTSPRGAQRIRIHAAGATELPTVAAGPLAVAAPARCLVDALRWAPLRLAIPLVWRELRDDGVSEREVTAALLTTAPDRARVRAASAWSAIQDAWAANGGQPKSACAA
ncbi:hypothetical protein [Demequina salsinemoris]|uniref:hypothetical protein n=1 Tax=Demequina salsinemoris TaxID=577470 RepID=UPI00078350E6|nr:hypothetical protein [Demequina salsinemoris]